MISKAKTHNQGLMIRAFNDGYQQGKADGAREFLAWYSGGETMPSFGRYAKCNIDDVIAEWQKGI